MMEAGGDVFHAVFDGMTPLCLDGSNWATAAKERTLAGRVVEGDPPAPGGARAVRMELAGGGAYAGAMRGLAYCGGVLADAGGAAWRVKHADGGRTFAEGQEPDAKEVLPERTLFSFILSPPAYTHVLKLLASLISASVPSKALIRVRV